MYFKMEENVLLARQTKKARITDANCDDNFIRSENYKNFKKLADQDAALADVVGMGDDAVLSMNVANKDLAR